MSPREINWPLLVVAFLCALPAVGGALLLFAGEEGYQALGFGLLGFFGSGVFVLGRKAFGRG